MYPMVPMIASEVEVESTRDGDVVSNLNLASPKSPTCATISSPKRMFQGYHIARQVENL